MKKNFPFLLLFILGVVACNPKAGSEPDPAGAQTSALSETDRKPDRIILMIGDGMGLTQITAGMLMNDNYLNLEEFPYIGLIKTRSSDNIITDSAAGATAFSAGVKTYNGAIGVDSDENPVPTILELAAERGYSTGLVATSSITHATPASFFAHQPSRSMNEAIAKDMLDAPVDVFIGGGKDFFTNREDQANLMDSLKNSGFTFYDSPFDIPSNAQGKIASLYTEKQPISILEGRSEELLVQASYRAIENLGSKDQFFLMIEGSQIDWEGHGNNSEGIVAEMIDFDNTIGAVLDFAKEDGNTLIIVTADHETGGYSIVGEDEEGRLEGRFTTGGHTGDLIPVFAYGPGSEKFSGIYENTAIFDKMKSLLK